MGMEIENEIGEFFGVHNLVEYKSPTDHNFNQCSICQALVYTYYYYARHQTWDVTLSLIVSKGHFDILNWLTSQGMGYAQRLSLIHI